MKEVQISNNEKFYEEATYKELLDELKRSGPLYVVTYSKHDAMFVKVVKRDFKRMLKKMGKVGMDTLSGFSLSISNPNSRTDRALFVDMAN